MVKKKNIYINVLDHFLPSFKKKLKNSKNWYSTNLLYNKFTQLLRSKFEVYTIGFWFCSTKDIYNDITSWAFDYYICFFGCIDYFICRLFTFQITGKKFFEHNEILFLVWLIGYEYKKWVISSNKCIKELFIFIILESKKDNIIY